MLLHNMELLEVGPGEIDCMVLSHSHGDHTGGVAFLLSRLIQLILGGFHLAPARIRS